MKRRSVVQLGIVLLTGGPGPLGCRRAASPDLVTAPAATVTSANAENREPNAMTESVDSDETELSTDSPGEDRPDAGGESRRGQQCNLLIDAVNAHTPKMTAATGGFAEVSTNPGVIETYEDVVQAAIDEVEGLEVSDERVSVFADRYLGILSAAKALGHGMLDAASDSALIPSIVSKADEIRETESALVSDINAYCQG